MPDEVSGVVFHAKIEIWAEAGGFDFVTAHEIEYALTMKLFFGDLGKQPRKLADMKHVLSIRKFRQMSMPACHRAGYSLSWLRVERKSSNSSGNGDWKRSLSPRLGW